MENPLKGMMDTSDAGTLGKALAEKQNIIEQDRAATAPKPAMPAAKGTAVVSPKDKINPKAGYGTGKGEKRIPEAADWAKPLSYKDGGEVKKTGLAMVHKGERVLTAQQHGNMNHAFDLAGAVLAQQSPEPDMPKKNIKEMHMRKGANGGFIVKHIHDHYMHPDEEHVHTDMDGVHDHMEQHWGEPNDGEEEHESAGVRAAEEAVGLK
jgi:hypothetical protein